jgi:hypothetical protein
MPPTGFGTRIRFESKESLTPRHDTEGVKPYYRVASTKTLLLPGSTSIMSTIQ